MGQQTRLIVASTAGYTARAETLGGREYLAVPVVGLLQGVVHALNAKHGPEFVPAPVFQDRIERWDGKPIFEGHPLVDGKPVRGDNRFMRDQRSIGLVKNPGIKSEQLVMEAWLDVENATRRAPVMLERARKGEPIEISVGVLVASDDDAAGEYNGRSYGAEWREIEPDHLALLPEGVLGACSRTMGCGVRALADGSMAPDELYTMWGGVNEKEEADVDHMYAAWLEDGSDDLLKTLRNISQDVRDKMPKEDFAGPNESFPIEQAVDVHDAAQSIGRAKGDRASIKRKIISIAYRKGSAFVAQLPDDWKKKSDMKAASMFARLMDAARTAFAPRDAQDAADMGRNDLMRNLYEALREVEPSVVNVEDYYPVTDPAHVVYTCYDGDSWAMFERPFDLATSGVVTLGAQKVEVQAFTKYEPVAGATPTALEEKQGEGAPASNGKQTPEDNTMKSEKVTKFLESATECQIKALEAFVEGGAQTVEPAKQPTEAELKALSDARAKEIRDAITADRNEQAALRVATDKKDASIKSLAAFGYKPEELADKTQDALDTMLATCEKVGKPANVTTLTDFAGAGGPRSNQQGDQVADAPDLGAKFRAAQEARQAKR